MYYCSVINFICAMKRLYLILCLPFVTLFSACSTDIDLYAGYKQAPIIYGLLDATADTNYIKITRAFYVEGNAYQVALNPDSSNYPGKLDARLVEYCNGDSVREIVLDTITVCKKEQGLFYANQRFYYTTEPLGKNWSNRRYSYKLKVVLPDCVLTTKADLVGSDNFDVQSLGVNFSQEYFDAVARRFLFRPALNAGFYNVSMSFTFLEQRTPDGDSVPRTMFWDLGYWEDSYLVDHMEENCYIFTYRPEAFYSLLRDFIGGDTMIGIHRFITDYPVEVTITAGGEELRQYIHNNNTSLGFSQGDSEFSLIDGGYGVFSSRRTVQHRVRLGGVTVPELEAVRKWGFKYIGGE